MAINRVKINCLCAKLSNSSYNALYASHLGSDICELN